MAPEEARRLACLADYAVMGTAPEDTFDRLTALGSAFLKLPMCAVNLIGEDEQWTKSAHGLNTGSRPRALSFCTHTIEGVEPLIVADAADDDRFRSNPYVVGEPGIRFYAGVPLINPEGLRLGAFCVLDHHPHPEFGEAEIDLLGKLGAIATERLETRRNTINLAAADGFAGATALALVLAGADGRIKLWNAAAERMFGYPSDQMIGQPLTIIMPERFRAAHVNGLARVVAGGTSTLSGKSVEVVGLRADGSEFPVELSVSVWQGPAGVEIGANLQDITERRARAAALQHMASHDELTGIPNRHGLDERLAPYFAGDLPVSLIVLDLDDFKLVNDTLGHAVGDLLLQMVAVRLASVMPVDGVLVRLSGDKFGIMLPGDDLIGVSYLARSLLAAFRDPFDIGARNLTVSFSIGAAIAPLHAVDAEQLLVRADLALLDAKKAGGRTFRVFNAGMEEQIAARRAFNDELLRAHAEREWELVYQPQVRLSDHRLIGAEALLRWRHPTRGLLAPGAFLLALEKHLLAYDVGCWVLDEACRQLVARRANGLALERISVNLFAAQIEAGTLSEVVATTLERHALRPQDLELEITETIVLRHDDEALAPLRHLHECGVSIAFDDFGTGYASLSTLKRFPLSRLKIDRSFVHDIEREPHSVAIVAGVASIGQALDLSVIAEGIETAEQARVVQKLGCTEGQGYLYGKPLDAASFERSAVAATDTGCARMSIVGR
mgnify:CR=1 FL=1